MLAMVAPLRLGLIATRQFHLKVANHLIIAVPPLFIHPEPKFIAHAKIAKKMIVEAEFYQEGMQDMEFNTAGLKWEH